MTIARHPDVATTDDEIAALVEETSAQYEQYLALSELANLAALGEQADPPVEEVRDMDRPLGLAVGSARA